MALATKFQIKGTSDVFGQITVNIKLNDYTGSIIELDGAGRDWVDLKIGDNSSSISNPILTGKLTVQFYVLTDFQTTEIGNSESFTYYVEALDGNNDLIWAGWAIPDEYKEAYYNTPYIATLLASDGLDELKTDIYDIDSGKETLLIHLINALDKTLLSLPIFESINIYSNGMSAGVDNSPLNQCSVVYDSFLKIKDNPNCYDVISSLLTPFFARIYQYRGWRVENILQKNSSYYVRRFNSLGVFQDYELFNPLVKLDTDYDDYKAFIQKSGNLVFNPALRNAEVYFNTVEPTSETVSGGFQREADWVSTSELVNWSTVGSLTVEKVDVNANGNRFGARIPGRVTTLDKTTNYIKSNSFTIDSANFQTIRAKFDFWANWPSIQITGGKPTLIFAAVFTETNTGFVYSWNNTWWAGTDIRLNFIYPEKRQVWKTFSIDIDRVPGDGVLEFRFYKLYKSGSEGSTALRLTGWNVNLIVEQPQNDRLLLEGGSTTIKTTVRGPSFQHYISDGLVLDSAGVIDANGTLTNSWNRRGKTDNLNIRRLFILQWLSFNSITQQVLTGNIFQRGESITPMSVIKDKDLVSTVRYVMQSFRMSLGSGFGTSNYRQINDTDATIVFFQEFLNEPRQIDYFPNRGTVPGSPTIAPPDQLTGGGDFPTGLNGDVRNSFDQSEITPAAIQNKSRLDLTGLTAEDIVIGAVKDSPDQENMTNLRVSDLKEFSAPVDKTYASEAAMIADQANQIAEYIYFDGTEYYEYLGTTTPSIADYRAVGGGSKWTDIGSDIYRNSRVLVGGTTFTDATAKLEVVGRISQVGLGLRNTAIGLDAGANIANSTGEDNTFIGTSAGRLQDSIITGFNVSENTAVGAYALEKNIQSVQNTAIGAGALGRYNETNQVDNGQNTALGHWAGKDLVLGEYNTLVGASAYRGGGSGIQNVFVGYDAGYERTGVNNSVVIGNRARTSGNSVTNEIVIGAFVTGMGSNTTVIGTFGTTNAYIRGNLNIETGQNIILGTFGAGTKIGTAAAQKLAFWNATPIVQPTTGVASASLVSNLGTPLTDTDTFDGYTVAQIIKALRNEGLLA